MGWRSKGIPDSVKAPKKVARSRSIERDLCIEASVAIRGSALFLVLGLTRLSLTDAKEARRLAMERFHLLQPHFEQNEPLRSVAIVD
jgi:hypothetical protein